jgi:5-methylcytosine-specific restriction endonuclease McrA
VVVGKDETWISESISVDVPSVVRLNRFVKVPYRRSAPVTRRAVFGRDGHRCQYCGGPAESLDHVLPRSRGGDHTWENVVACCRPCNISKGDRLPVEAGFRLNTKPGPPRRYAWIYASTGYQVDPAWHPYLEVA